MCFILWLNIPEFLICVLILNYVWLKVFYFSNVIFTHTEWLRFNIRTTSNFKKL